MNAVVVGLCGALVIAGVFALGVGFSPQDEPARKTVRASRVRRLWNGWTMRFRLFFVAMILSGLAAFVVTGWVALLIVVPMGGLVLPLLLADPKNRDIELLEALDRWVRSLTASLPTGKSLTDAIRSTMGHAPTLLAPSVRLLVARVDERWRLWEALMLMADELDSADADAVIASLVIASERGGVGATSTLNSLSDSIQHRLVAAREIEAERAKPRIVVRQVTLVTLSAIVVATLFGRGYFDPFGSSIGQVIVIGLALGYFGSLLGLRKLSSPRQRDRILRSSSVQKVGMSHA